MSIDREIEDLRQQIEKDPQNEDLVAKLINLRSRVEGAGVYLELLKDRRRWNDSPDTLQDLAILEAGRRLGSQFEHVHTKVYHCNGISHRIATFRQVTTSILLNLIPGGSFLMGTKEVELEDEWRFCQNHGMNWPLDSFKCESPQLRHTVNPFLISRYPLLKEEWNTVTKEDLKEVESLGYPVEDVCFNDAKKWICQLGLDFRLPSEIEWEYACRAGSTSRFYWGDTPTDEYKIVDGRSGAIFGPSTTRDSQCNAFGLVDIVGSVHQWCDSIWNGKGYDKPDFRSNYYPLEAVLRGGSWVSTYGFARSAHRFHLPPESPSLTGFRITKSI